MTPLRDDHMESLLNKLWRGEKPDLSTQEFAQLARYVELTRDAPEECANCGPTKERVLAGWCHRCSPKE